MPAILIPGQTVTLNQDGSLSVTQRYSLAQSEITSFSPSQPTSPTGTYELESISATNLEAGLAEATAVWRRPNAQTPSGSAGNLRNVTVEVVASAREEPISLLKGSANFDFSTLEAYEVRTARNAGEGLLADGSQASTPQAAIDALSTAKQKNLAKYFQRGIEYFLSPSVTLRVSGRASSVNTTYVGKVYATANLPMPSDMRPTIPSGKNYEWLLVSVTSRSVPPTDQRSTLYFEVTEEYLLSGPAGWDENIYTDGTASLISPS